MMHMFICFYIEYGVSDFSAGAGSGETPQLQFIFAVSP